VFEVALTAKFNLCTRSQAPLGNAVPEAPLRTTERNKFGVQIVYSSISTSPSHYIGVEFQGTSMKTTGGPHQEDISFTERIRMLFLAPHSGHEMWRSIRSRESPMLMSIVC